MNKLLDGLRLGASSKTVALSELSADQIITNLSDEQKAELAGKLAPKAEEPVADSEPAPEKPKAESEEAPADEEPEPEADAADPESPQFKAGFAAAVDRNSAVFASEHFVGREKAAASLLGNQKLSADEIISALAALPKGSSGNNMLDGLKGSANPDLQPGSEATGTNPQQESRSSWDRTFAKLGWATEKKPA